VTATMTAADLLKADQTFRTLLQTWWEHKEIPVVTLDYLLDFDLYPQSEALRWMLEQPKRYSGTTRDDRFTKPAPIYYNEPEFRDWGWDMSAQSLPYACSLPDTLFLKPFGTGLWLVTKEGPLQAICLALDSWRGR
jgi:hypothetical protein